MQRMDEKRDQDEARRRLRALLDDYIKLDEIDEEILRIHSTHCDKGAHIAEQNTTPFTESEVGWSLQDDLTKQIGELMLEHFKGELYAVADWE